MKSCMVIPPETKEKPIHGLQSIRGGRSDDRRHETAVFAQLAVVDAVVVPYDVFDVAGGMSSQEQRFDNSVNRKVALLQTKEGAACSVVCHSVLR